MGKSSTVDMMIRRKEDNDEEEDEEDISDGDLDLHLREKTKNQPCDSVADACQQSVQLISFAGQSKLMIGKMKKSNKTYFLFRQNLQISQTLTT